ncbi:MAG: hypothetical protein AB1600_03780 [Bacteroidota bacterium]
MSWFSRDEREGKHLTLRLCKKQSLATAPRPQRKTNVALFAPLRVPISRDGATDAKKRFSTHSTAVGEVEAGQLS